LNVEILSNVRMSTVSESTAFVRMQVVIVASHDDTNFFRFFWGGQRHEFWDDFTTVSHSRQLPEITTL